ELGRILGRIQRWWRAGAELAVRVQQQRLHRRQPRIKERREQRRRRTPHSWSQGLRERRIRTATVVLPYGDDPCRCALAELDSPLLRLTIGDLAERLGVRVIKPILRQREVVQEHPIGGRR